MTRKPRVPLPTEAQKSEVERLTHEMLVEILGACPELTKAMRAERARQARIRRRLSAKGK